MQEAFPDLEADVKRLRIAYMPCRSSRRPAPILWGAPDASRLELAALEPSVDEWFEVMPLPLV
jgi:hypothetical protein